MMENKQKVCVCGGGNIGHSLVVAFGMHDDVNVLTRRPDAWSEHLLYQIADGVCEKTRGRVVASSDASIISESTIVIIALPRFAIEEELVKLEPWLHAGQTLVFVPAPAGMEGIVERMANKGVEVIGFQRVPYVARIREYGKFVWMGTLRSVSKLAISNLDRKHYWKDFFEQSIGGEVSFLSSFLSFTFSNSNPLLHPARLVELLSNNEGYRKCPYFYAEWGDRASELYVSADDEMRKVFETYSHEAMMTDYESALVHYEVNDILDLSKKIRSIKSLHDILAPYCRANDGLWYPDFSSRYFTEDIPYGTKIIQRYARKFGVVTPVIDMLISKVSRV